MQVEIQPLGKSSSAKWSKWPACRAGCRTSRQGIRSAGPCAGSAGSRRAWRQTVAGALLIITRLAPVKQPAGAGPSGEEAGLPGWAPDQPARDPVCRAMCQLELMKLCFPIYIEMRGLPSPSSSIDTPLCLMN